MQIIKWCFSFTQICTTTWPHVWELN